MFAVARLGERLAGREATGTAAALPGVLLAVALVAPAIMVVSNQLSRAVERSADAFALELSNEPKTQIAFQRRIAVEHLRPRPARRSVPARDAPADDRADRSGRDGGEGVVAGG